MIDFMFFVASVVLALWVYQPGAMGAFGLFCAVAAWCFRGWIEDMRRQDD